MDIKFEYLGEDRDVPTAKIWKVEAIHVTTTKNKRRFTQTELESAGRSLSFRPLNINHDENRNLRFPENATLAMNFDPSKMAVIGTFRVNDPTINAMIETNRINQVSIEQIPTKGESCNEILCEQHGVAFIGLALLESHVTPGDEKANIIKSESSSFLSLSEMVVSNEQRICPECSDFEACHSCKHKTEEQQRTLIKHFEAIQKKFPDKKHNEILPKAIERAGLGNSNEQAWFWYNRMKN